jgi:hypothetical protein
MKIILAAVLSTLTVATPVHAAESIRPMTLGAGGITCASWTRSDDAAYRSRGEQWILGWISAYNTILANESGIVATGTDAKQGKRFDLSEGYTVLDVLDWTRAWCRNNPLEKLDMAAHATTNELATRLGKR